MLASIHLSANSGQSFPANKDLLPNVLDHSELHVSPSDLWDSFIKQIPTLWSVKLLRRIINCIKTGFGVRAVVLGRKLGDEKI